jgi:GNAT superfamily N-acetyltransferase
MFNTKPLPQEPLNAFQTPVPSASAGAISAAAPNKSPLIVPIRSLGVNHRERITRHLLALEPHDRYLRFGFAANDESIQHYTDGLNFERDEIFGIYNRRLELIAMAHLAFSADNSLDACAEFGVSVSKSARGRGFGARLFERAAMHARNEGVNKMFIHALSENTTMIKIALNAGATIEREGSESEAHLVLLPATMDTRLTEMLQEQLAQADYQIKVQVKQLRRMLAGVPPMRRDRSDAQQSCPK